MAGVSQPPSIASFADALRKLEDFNSVQSSSPEIEGPIGQLNEVVIRLGNVNSSLREMLEKISNELSKMKASNLTASKQRLSGYMSSMAKSLNEIERLIPTGASSGASASSDSEPGFVSSVVDAANAAISGEQSGGFQYGRMKKSRSSKSKTKKASSKRRHNKTRR